MIKLVTKSDIRMYSQLSTNTDEQLVNLFIEDCQLVDLKPLLGELLYQDMIDNTSTQPYQDLLNGVAYTYDGNSYYSDGIKPVLSKFVYGRYLLTSSNVDTGFGMVQKRDQNSTASDFEMKKTLNKLYYQQGYEYFKSVRNYLDRHATTYPLWDNDCSVSTQRTFKINKIV